MFMFSLRRSIYPFSYGEPLRCYQAGESSEIEGRVGALLSEALLVGRPRLDAVRPDLRPLFTVSIHTGLRWSEQRRLEWRAVDFLTRLITVRQSKSGYARQVPMNSIVRAALMDLAGHRTRPDDPEAPVFRCSYVQPDHFFPKAVERAADALKKAKRDASRLDGYTWHCNRHSFASRSGWFLVPGEPPLTLQHFKKTSSRVSRLRLVYRKCLTRL